MTAYSIDLFKAATIKFKPGSVTEEIVQNVRTICSTIIGTVPLDRDFGTSMDMLDNPINLSRLLFQSAVIQALARYEPRAKLVQIDYSGSSEELSDGVTKPRLTIKIEEQNV